MLLFIYTLSYIGVFESYIYVHVHKIPYVYIQEIGNTYCVHVSVDIETLRYWDPESVCERLCFSFNVRRWIAYRCM